MNTNKNLSILSRANSFRFALNGLAALMKEPNAKLHLVAAIVVVTAGFVQHISHRQWIAISFAIGLVWITEALNTCLEKLCDFACKGELHPAIKTIKDIAAGAVLIASITSIVIACIIFIY